MNNHEGLARAAQGRHRWVGIENNQTWDIDRILLDMKT